MSAEIRSDAKLTFLSAEHGTVSFPDKLVQVTTAFLACCIPSLFLVPYQSAVRYDWSIVPIFGVSFVVFDALGQHMGRCQPHLQLSDAPHMIIVPFIQPRPRTCTVATWQAHVQGAVVPVQSRHALVTWYLLLPWINKNTEIVSVT